MIVQQYSNIYNVPINTYNEMYVSDVFIRVKKNYAFPSNAHVRVQLRD